MSRDLKLYLQDIVDAGNHIRQFVHGIDSWEQFKNDEKTSSAVLRKLEIIGEAIKQVPFKVREQYPNIPWKEMAGMRDRLIHAYFGVDYKLVWKTINSELPDILKAVTSILEHKREE
jgi:uncharacterized protein with HEPN domain